MTNQPQRRRPVGRRVVLAGAAVDSAVAGTGLALAGAPAAATRRCPGERLVLEI